MHDVWLPLKNKAGKSKDQAKGKLHIRFLYSCSPETKPAEDRGQQIFFYDDYIDSFKTGDLLIFSGIGALHSMNKLITNSPYSHVGMVFRLPNKWTRRDDLFVLEVAKNAEGFLDAFLERPYTGVALYRLLERLHQYQGTKIWWAPLNTNSSINQKKLIETMWRVHEENVNFSLTRQPGARKMTDKSVFLLENELNSELQVGALSKESAMWETFAPYNITKVFPKGEVVELLDVKLITHLLNAAGGKQSVAYGMERMQQNQRLFPADVAAYDCFGKPVLLRDVDFTVQTEKSQLPQHFFIVQDSSGMQPLPTSTAVPQQSPMSPPPGQSPTTFPQQPPPGSQQNFAPVMYPMNDGMMTMQQSDPYHFPLQGYPMPPMQDSQAAMYGYNTARPGFMPQFPTYPPQQGSMFSIPSPGSEQAQTPPPFNPEYAADPSSS